MKINVTERQVRKYAQLEKLPRETQREVIDGKISLNKAIEQNTEKEKSESIVLTKLLENLSSEQRNMLLSGKINLSSIITKAEPVPIFEGSKNEDTAPTPKQTRSQDGSVLIYKNGQFIPNKIQILEEHEEYTVFKVFAVNL